MEFSLRPAEHEDFEFCRDLSMQNMAVYFHQFGIAWVDHRFVASWSELENWVVLGDLASIGSLRLSPRGSVLDIRELQVVPSCRSQGAATWVIQRAKAIASSRGYSHLGLRVFISNPAQRLYGRLGFQETHRDEQSIHMVAPTT